MANAKKLPSGNWRVLVFNGYKYVDGKRKRDYISITATTENEANYLALEHELHYKEISRDSTKMKLSEAIDKYIAMSGNILSPTTIQGYKKIKKNNFQNIMDTQLYKLTAQKLNEEINNEIKRPSKQRGTKDCTKGLSPKTVINAYGLISAVLNEFHPKLDTSRVRMPEKQKIIKEVLPPEIIFDAVKGTSVELPVLLAMWLSFSMSEIRGLTKSKSINGDYITIRETVVDVAGKVITKDAAKEYERIRRHRIPPYIKTLIAKTDPTDDRLITVSAGAITSKFYRILQRNNLPHMRFHDLRHINASVMVELNVPDKYAQERGGWKTEHTMKEVYQHTFSKARKEIDDKIDEYFESKMQHKMQHKKLKYRILRGF